MAGNGRKAQLSISLPTRAVELLEQLALTGLYSDKKAVVASELVQESLRQWVREGKIDLRSTGQETDQGENT